MSVKDFIGYVIARIVGALAGSALTSFVVSSSYTLAGFGANGY